MAARDRWVGWDDATRARNLQRVVNNSRFLLLPWVAVSNLASAVLSRGLGRLAADWPRRYGLEPWLVETLAADGQRRALFSETAGVSICELRTTGAERSGSSVMR